MTRSNGRRASAKPAPSQRDRVGPDARSRPVRRDRSSREVVARSSGRPPRRAPRRRPRRRRATGPRSRAAPLPANRSRTRAPGRSGSRIAKSVCLTRSASGRVPGPGARSRRPAGRARDHPPGVRPRSVDALARRSPGQRPSQPLCELAAEGGARLGDAAGRPRRAAPRRGAGAPSRARDDRRAGARRPAAAGKPALGEAEHVALPAQLEVLLGQLEPVAGRCDGLEAGPGDRRSVESETRTQNDSIGPAPDPAAELVELGQPEALGALDDHHRRPGTSTPDLDDGRPDQHVELAVAEAASSRRRDRRPSSGRGPGRPEADRAGLAQADRLGLGRDGARRVRTSSSRCRPACLDERHDHERPMAGCRLGRGPAATSRRARLGSADAGPDRDAAGRRASAGRTRRGRRRGPGRASAGSASRSSAGRAADGPGRLRLELAALLDPEAVLLVDHDQPESANVDRFLDERMRPDDDARLAGSRSPRAALRFAVGRCSEPVSRVTPIDRPSRSAPTVSRAGGRAGRSGRGGRPGAQRSAARARACAATAVLPEPTSPWSRRSIGCRPGEVGPDRVDRRRPGPASARSAGRPAAPSRLAERGAHPGLDRRPTRRSARPGCGRAGVDARPSRAGARAARRRRVAGGPRSRASNESGKWTCSIAPSIADEGLGLADLGRQVLGIAAGRPGRAPRGSPPGAGPR